MDTSFVDALIARAQTLLPPATVMALECAADAEGGGPLEALLTEIQQKGLRGEALCAEPWEPVVFDDRVLLRCRGCPRMERLPKILATGRGRTEAEARHNALYALTLPLDRHGRRREGYLAALTWGQGPVEVTETVCVLDRVAYGRAAP